MTKEDVKVRPFGGAGFSEEDLIRMEPILLRVLLHERTHHNIEVPFYQIFLKKDRDPKPSFGQQAQIVLDIWRKRGLPEGEADIEWAKEYVVLAEKIQTGETIEWQEPIPEPFSDEEIAVVEKLIFGRHSVRNWIDKPVPDKMIVKILEAGRAAPIGCNLGEIRFIVLRDPEKLNMLWSDIPTKNAVVIVICYDKRIPQVVSQDQFVPQNAGFDAAAAADHMLLMAHALGLGAVWLSKTVKTDLTEDTGERFRKTFGLPDYIEVALHIAVGWSAVGTVKTKRLPLKNMILNEDLELNTAK